jgi:TolB-like protein
MKRNLFKLFLMFGLSLVLSSPLSAEEKKPAAEKPAGEKAGGKLNLMVLDLEAEKGMEGLARSLTDEILLHLGKVESLAVSGQAEISMMLKHEKDKKLLMCKDDRSCLAQISSTLNAEKAIVGRVGRLGENFVVTLKLTDTKKVSVESGESVSAVKEAELLPLVREAADRLLGLSAGGAKAKFKLEIAEEGTSMAVLDLGAHGVEASTASNLTDLLSLELKKFKGLSVVSRSEIQAMLQYQSDKMVLECTSDTSCLIEIGGALGVDYLVSGGVGKLGKSFVLNLKLLNIHKAQVTNRVSETFEGDESELVRALRFGCHGLLGRVKSGKGDLGVSANVSEAKITLDGVKAMKYPLKGPVTGLETGKHGVDMASEGYYSLYKEAYVETDKVTAVRFDLVELPVPWYKKWWVWTIVGTAVVGGGTTAALLAMQEPPTGTVTVRFESE